MRRAFAVCVLALLAALPARTVEANLEARFTPFDHARLCLEDVQKGGRPTWRYLAVPNVPVAERVQLKQTADYVLNSLSRRPRIIRTVGLPNDQAPAVLRLDLADYSIRQVDWDALAEQGSGAVPLPEPYHYIPVEKEVEEYWEAGTDNSGKSYAAGFYKRKKKTIDPGPWMLARDQGRTYNALYQATNRARAPLVRADWFIAYASTAPAYYRLLGLKNKEAEFEALLNVDKARARVSLVAAVAHSRQVALHNRILNRLPTVSGRTGGYLWFSFDTNAGIDRTDYLNNLDVFDSPVFQAKELIGTLPNMLQAYAVTNAQGNLVNVADADIALHSDALPTRLQDKKVWSGLRNCAFCHHGIRPIDCKVRSLAQGEVGLAQLFTGRLKDLKIQEKINDAFGEPLEELIDHDNKIYEAAVKKANGLTARQNALQLEQFVFDYLDRPITLATAARESGYTEAQLATLIKASAGVDHTLVGLAKQQPTHAERLAWERRGFIQLMLLTTTTPPQ